MKNYIMFFIAFVLFVFGFAFENAFVVFGLFTTSFAIGVSTIVRWAKE